MNGQLHTGDAPSHRMALSCKVFRPVTLVSGIPKSPFSITLWDYPSSAFPPLPAVTSSHLHPQHCFPHLPSSSHFQLFSVEPFKHHSGLRNAGTEALSWELSGISLLLHWPGVRPLSASSIKTWVVLPFLLWLYSIRFPLLSQIHRLSLYIGGQRLSFHGVRKRIPSDF